MDPKDQKDVETASEPQVDTSIELKDSDLDTVTGGLLSIGGAAAPIGDSCITSLG
jgi:hypothetical protein